MIKLFGFDKLKKKIKRMMTVEYPHALMASMYDITMRTMREAIIRTPVDTGFLKSSFYTKVWKGKKDVVNGLVYNTMSYAPYVHEILTNKHIIGEAKFLEKAMAVVTPNVNKIIRFRLRLAQKEKMSLSSAGYTKPQWKTSIRR